MPEEAQHETNHKVDSSKLFLYGLKIMINEHKVSY